MGRVKDLNSIPNLRTLLTKERFSDVILTYLGGMWVMIEMDNEATKLKLLQHIGVNSWFHVLQAVIHDFVSDERVVWVDIEGFPLNVWSRETFLKIGKKWGEIMDIEENLVSSFARKRLRIKTKQAVNILEKFKVIFKGKKNDHRGVDLNTETDKVNSPLVHTKVMNNSQKVHENVTSNGASAFNYSHNAHNGGSILEVLDDMIRVGQSMGYAMEGCMKDIEHIIRTQGVDATKMDRVNHMDVKFIWGNSNYQYVSSDSAGSSGGVLCVWEATIFKKDYATVFDNFIAIYETWIFNNFKVLIVVIYAP
nr:RNA-directed DNA polymerase, eukaryota [Tanacetum cinerariifolium]